MNAPAFTRRVNEAGRVQSSEAALSDGRTVRLHSSFGLLVDLSVTTAAVGVSLSLSLTPDEARSPGCRAAGLRRKGAVTCTI